MSLVKECKEWWTLHGRLWGPTKDLLGPQFIGIWCNGNTSVFGAEFIGSNPVIPTFDEEVFDILAHTLVYGVMVAQEALTLLVWVRILVG